jgi:hypothetical protein
MQSIFLRVFVPLWLKKAARSDAKNKTLMIQIVRLILISFATLKKKIIEQLSLFVLP